MERLEKRKKPTASLLSDQTPAVKKTRRRFCGEHGEYTAEVLTFGKIEIESRCPLCQERIVEQERQERQEREKQERQMLEMKYVAMGITPRYMHESFESYKVSSNASKKALEACKS
jgi:DNA replication protein DnaC